MVLFNVGLATSLLLQWASNTLLPSSTASSSSSSSCTTSAGDLSALVSCHVSLVLQRDLNNITFAAIQPTPSQRSAWSETIQSLLNVDGNCSTIARYLPAPLQPMYTVREVGGFCAMVEVSTVSGGRGGRVEYEKGWGLFATPARKGQVKRDLHFSAPHPIFDMRTETQAGHVFEGTGAKSLYIAGRVRDAFREETDCVRGTPTNWKTDPAHDNKEMMFDTYKTIFEWQNAQVGNCEAASCAYVQFHGKGNETCALEQIFLSSGIGRTTAGLGWYTDPANAGLPIHRILEHASASFPEWNVTIPSSPHSTCSRLAVDNIEGRLINGVPEDRVCRRSAAVSPALRGEFVHIEQDIKARRNERLETWVRVFLESFVVRSA